jgi:NAD(P)-dependent dehydrogenase (short-subunit alcohol dehydrogenase family)
MSNPSEFAGKVVLVTGGARGIGLAIARRFGVEGARVIVADISQPNGEQTVLLLRKLGTSADFVLADLAAPGGAAAMVRTTMSLAGRLDVLINNARAGQRLGLLEETEENWDLTTSVGMKAPFFAAQETVKWMLAHGGGCIVNVASVAAMLSTNEAASYHAAKAGIMQLTRYLAVAAGPYNVRVNCVLPGLIVQDEHRARFQAPGNEAYRQIAAFYQPMGGVGTEADVAEAALFLCSSRSSYISGACLVVDGGATVQEQFGMLLRLSKLASTTTNPQAEDQDP